jgi:cell wall-associated NlpC family hydrolase
MKRRLTLLLCPVLLAPTVRAETVTSTWELRQLEALELLAQETLTYLGVPYRRGGDHPDQGFDCSGLVRHVVDKVLNLELPRRAEEMSRLGRRIERSELRPGDLVFFNTLRRPFSHVGIYLGDGRFVHAPSSGGVVRIERMDLPYWRSRYNGIRRLDSAPPA